MINLLGDTENLDSANWDTRDLTVSDEGGGVFKALPAATTNNHNFQDAITASTSGTGNHTISIYAKANGYNFIGIRFVSGTPGTTGNRPGQSYAHFNLSTGAVGALGSGSISSGISDEGSGWYRCYGVFSVTVSGTFTVQFRVMETDQDADFPSFLADGTSSVLVRDPQFEVGSTPGVYTPT